jgi:hypothetical protein
MKKRRAMPQKMKFCVSQKLYGGGGASSLSTTNHCRMQSSQNEWLHPSTWASDCSGMSPRRHTAHGLPSDDPITRIFAKKKKKKKKVVFPMHAEQQSADFGEVVQ